MYLPEQILTNQDLEKKVDTSDEWIRERTGIVQRRIAREDEATSDMAAEAARRAMASAKIDAGEVEMIIVCTSTPDVLFPSTACFVQKKLGAVRAVAYDISAVCSGFVFGLSIAEQFIKVGRYKCVLVIGSEAYSRILDWSDRSTCILFGDGAGAVVLKQGASAGRRGVLSTHIFSDGSLANLVEVPGGVGRARISREAIDDKQYVLRMNGGSTFKIAVRRMSEAILNALKFHDLTLDDVNLVIPHQANKRIIDAIGKKLNLPSGKTFVNIDKYGNTSAASIPIAIHEARECGRIKPGDLIVLSVLGSGLTWGAAVIRW
ncbi:MAG: beta-ketoacyl-ACP synthase III [Nitrospinales bacterium]